ncbi:soluble cytochrome b562 [Alteromonadaceae bacterium Bs31]|nr:soluble cytochrome b562 [Alteromonadaceae bacterium Bs31]
MKILVLALLVSAMLSVLGCSRGSDLHEAMESMGDSMKAMSKSEELEQLKKELGDFTAALEVAVQQKVKEEDQLTFDEGLKKVQDGTAKIQQALEQGNADLAKKLLKELHELEEKYHEKLGVED